MRVLRARSGPAAVAAVRAMGTPDAAAAVRLKPADRA